MPAWLGKLKAGDFDGAKAVLAGLSALGKRNPELRPMVGELEWLGDLQRLVSGRGGADAPIRIYADEDRIGALVERWNTNTGEHQRTLARIASHVPQFGAPYAEALTHLRRLQSDATVYLGAIERLKASIAAELNRDSPEALEGVLKEYADKYPGIGGLDSVRQDLARYIETAQRSACAQVRPPVRTAAEGAVPDAAVPGELARAGRQRAAAAGRPGAAVRRGHAGLEARQHQPGAGRAAEVDGSGPLGRSWPPGSWSAAKP